MVNDDEKNIDYVAKLVWILARLRAEDGCPWDRKQTHQSLKPYLTEETAEFFDALEDGDDFAIADELGDILLQIVFHCQIASEEKRFDLQKAAQLCCEKMIRRHPHVFAEAQADTSEQVLNQWEEIKKQERQDRGQAPRKSFVSGVPRHLPALTRADKIQQKAAKVGFDWPDLNGVIGKIDEELMEVREAIANNDSEAVAEEIGDLLFSVVNLARSLKFCPEGLLHNTVRKFETRFEMMEKILTEQGKALESSSLEQMDEAWEKSKKILKNDSQKVD